MTSEYIDHEVGAKYVRLKLQRYRLTGDVCNEGHPTFPPDEVCKDCNPETARTNAITRSVVKTNRSLIDIKERIAVYEANPDLYKSLDEIKLP